MPIIFECPTCQRKLKIPDELAGKKCRCSTCKQGFVVPGIAGAALPAPPQPSPAAKSPTPAPARAPVAARGGDGAASTAKRPAPPRRPPATTPLTPAPEMPQEDVEALAAAAFADKPPEPEVVVNENIKFDCEYCGFSLEVSADLSGKRTQCADCRRITRVPEVVKREAKEWHRAAQTAAQEAAAEASREGAWGTSNIKAADQKALIEAGILDDTPPLTRSQTIVWWSVRGVAAAAVMGVLLFSVVQTMSWWNARKQERMFKETFTFAAEDKVPPEGVAVLHIAGGDYRRRQARARDGNRHGTANEARGQFTEAYKLLASGDSADRDLALTRLAQAEIELGGDGDDVTREIVEKWDDVQRSLRTTLSAIASPNARAVALRATCRRLLALKQSKRALALALQVTDPAGVEREDRIARAEILAQVGLDFLSKERPLAEQVASHLAGFGANSGDPPPPQPSVVALLTAIGSTTPPPPVAFVAPANKDKESEERADREKEMVGIGVVEALARQGRVDEARRLAEQPPLAGIARLRAMVAIAEAVHDANPGDRTDIDAACRFAATLADKRLLDEGQLRQLDWTLLGLTELGVAVGVEQDGLAALTALISPELRSRAQFVVFHARAVSAKGALEESAADTVDAKTLARGLARLELARLNTRRSNGYADKVAAWSDGLRSYGTMGALQGLQGGGDAP